MDLGRCQIRDDPRSKQHGLVFSDQGYGYCDIDFPVPGMLEYLIARSASGTQPGNQNVGVKDGIHLGIIHDT